MNFANLKYFLAVANTQNITKAAEKMHISQQALSSLLRNMEKELGVELYNRGKHISLTYAGMRLTQYASDILRLEQQMQQEFRSIGNNERGALHIAINPTRSAALLPQILPTFYEEFPNVEVTAMEASPSRVDDLLMEGAVDISVGLHPWVSNVIGESLYNEMLVALVPKKIINSAFGSTAESMRKKLTDSFTPVLFNGVPTIMLAKGMQIRAWVDEYFQTCAFTPNILYESTGVHTMLALALSGLGIAYCTETFLYSIIDSLQSISCPIDVFPVVATKGRYPLGVFYRRDLTVNAFTRRFIELVENYYRNGVFSFEAGSVHLRRSN